MIRWRTVLTAVVLLVTTAQLGIGQPNPGGGGNQRNHCQDDPMPPGCGPIHDPPIVNKKLEGALLPRNFIYSVEYAPPGGAGSSVSYQSTSKLGTTVTAEQTFERQGGVKVSVKDTGSIFSTGVSVQRSNDEGGQTSQEITKTGTETHTLNTVQDGINHGDDIVRIWVNP